MNISKKIAFCRKALGISQEELAALLNVSRQAVSRWETSAAMPDTEKIIQLSRVFDVTTDYLLLDEVSGGEKAEAEPERIALKTDPAAGAEHAIALSVKERRRKFRIAAWIFFLVFGLSMVIFALVLAEIWAVNTDWWWTAWGAFGTGLFHTWRLAPFLIGIVLLIPGVAGLVYEYRRED